MHKDLFTSLVQATQSTMLSTVPDGTHIHSKNVILQPVHNLVDADATILVLSWIFPTSMFQEPRVLVKDARIRLSEIAHNHYREKPMTVVPPAYCYLNQQDTPADAPEKESPMVDESVKITSIVDTLVEYLANHPEQRKEIICRLL